MVIYYLLALAQSLFAAAVAGAPKGSVLQIIAILLLMLTIWAGAAYAAADSGSR